MDTWLASERYYRKRYIRNIFFYMFSFLGLSITRPIRNTGPCFPPGLYRQRGQRDMLSHTEFYRPIFCMLSVFQAIPFELRRKPPTVNRWDPTLGTPRGDKYYNQYRPLCEVCPRDHGKVVESLQGNDICLMNDNSYTYMHYPTGFFLSIDPFLCHPSLFLDFSWSVCKDQHHSDHFPILIESNTSTIENHNPKWKLNKAYWELFYCLCSDKISTENFKDSSDPLLDFTSSLIDISSKCIPKTSTNPTKGNPWYKDECKQAIKTRKKALNKLKKLSN